MVRRRPPGGRSAALEALTLRHGARRAARTCPPNTFLAVNVGPDVIDHPEVLTVLNGHRNLGGVVIELTEHARIDSYVSLEPVAEPAARGRRHDRHRRRGRRLRRPAAPDRDPSAHHQARPQLISGIDRDETKRALVEMIGTFASRIDAWVLAEGIEHLGELDAVIEPRRPDGPGVPAGPARRALGGRSTADGAALLRHQIPSRAEHSLRKILERTATVYDKAAAAGAFADDATDLVVMLDAHHRPVATMDADGLVHSALDPSIGSAWTPPSRRPPSARSPGPPSSGSTRCCASTSYGRYMGVVRMERVVTYLSARTPATDSPLFSGTAQAGLAQWGREHRHRASSPARPRRRRRPGRARVAAPLPGVQRVRRVSLASDGAEALARIGRPAARRPGRST